MAAGTFIEGHTRLDDLTPYPPGRRCNDGPMNFHLVDGPTDNDDPIAADLALLQHAGQPSARLWQAPTSLVVPRSYRRHAGFDAVAAQFSAHGCPVHERPSGGGLVPQGPGILNLSLAYTLPGGLGAWMEPVYHHLCALLQGVLQTLGVPSHWQAVTGSFCDGRFNLACGAGAQARKIAGTAQYWRPLPRHLAGPGTHAVLLVNPDLAAAHARANAFEQALGSGRQYDPAKTVSVAQMLGPQAPAELMQRVRQRLADAVQNAGLPEHGASVNYS